MSHDEIARVAFAVIVKAREQGIADPLRLAHAIAVGVLLAEDETKPCVTDWLCLPDARLRFGECIEAPPASRAETRNA